MSNLTSLLDLKEVLSTYKEICTEETNVLLNLAEITKAEFFITCKEVNEGLIEEVKGHKKLVFINGDTNGGTPTRNFQACLPILEPHDTVVLFNSRERSVQRAVGRVEAAYPWWTQLKVDTANKMVIFGVKEHPAKDLNGLMKMLALYREKDGIKHGYWSGEAEYPILFALACKHKPDLVIETGTCAGVSALTFVLAGSLTGFPIMVETYDPKNVPKVYAQAIDLEDQITYTQGEFVGKKIDNRIKKMFFIDGDHSTEGCLKDLREATKTVLREGDVIVIHDAQRVEVAEAIRTFCREQVITQEDKAYVIPSNNFIYVIEF
jgi:predicted O-methyltransferase YrrM